MEQSLVVVWALANLVSALSGLSIPSVWPLPPHINVAANMFIGGIIIATALVHLLAEAAEADDGGFPWSMVLAGAGYLVMLSLEALAFVNKDYMELRPLDEPTPVVVCNHHAPGAVRNHHHAPGAAAVTTLALGLHAIGDGVAIAVQPTPSKLTAVGLAIVCHKFFSAYALGTMLVGPNTRKWERLPYAIAFAFATPSTLILALFSGIDVMGDGHAVTRASALCAGSLLYVGIDEIVRDHFVSPLIPQVSKLVLLWAGFSVMSLLAVWV